MFSTDSASFSAVSSFFFFDQSFSLSLWIIFDPNSFNIDEVFLINPSVNVFVFGETYTSVLHNVFGDLHIRHNNWLTYSSRTDRPGEMN